MVKILSHIPLKNFNGVLQIQNPWKKFPENHKVAKPT